MFVQNDNYAADAVEGPNGKVINKTTTITAAIITTTTLEVFTTATTTRIHLTKRKNTIKWTRADI